MWRPRLPRSRLAVHEQRHGWNAGRDDGVLPRVQKDKGDGVNGLVLSLFPGIGLLDRAFDIEEFCVVRGPDLLWGGDVRNFHPPAGRFDGVIGGPPCQAFSQVNQSARMGLTELAANLIPEFERVVTEARPSWFLMENVIAAPLPVVSGYLTVERILNNRWLGEEQNRVRRFSFGVPVGLTLESRTLLRRFSFDADLSPFNNPIKTGCFTANGTQWDADKGRSRGDRSWASVRRGLKAQGLPSDFFGRWTDRGPENCVLTSKGATRVIGNGVPIPMGRAIARAVKRALFQSEAA